MLITHRNLVASLCGCIDTGLYVRKTTVYLSYLPLAHVLERLMHCGILEEGGRIGFYQGSTVTLLDDIKALRPTVFVSVPRLYVLCDCRIVLCGVAFCRFIHIISSSLHSV